ncbi:MAG: class I SAM-dependent methyltransferase [Bacteroidetes bacterium]|nr:class I SAM-dependent methyltransferase [Bacteroidota bacterium]MBL7103421.1 class I SAM-dependent methyltransferase [Bacteroidales bacterium]
MNFPENELADAFRDVDSHLECAEIIRTHSSNKKDIRKVALEGIDLINTKHIVDIGCGFGFFTEALFNKTAPEIIVSGIDCFDEYRDVFLNLCKKCDFKGKFYNSGVDALQAFERNCVDLILSSYSLYFFPRIIPQLARILDSSGVCIIITHSGSHLKELYYLVLKALYKNGYKQLKTVPYDELVNNFSGDNGYRQLSEHFGSIEKKDFINELIFSAQATEKYLQYFRHKKSFLLPDFLINDYKIIRKVEEELINHIIKTGEIRITKNDTVFICTNPIKK